MAVMPMWKHLAEVALLSGLTPEELAGVADAGAVFTDGAGRAVVRKGDPAPGLRVVLDGEAVVDVDGVVRGRLRPGDHFGDISLLDGEPASSTVTAVDGELRTFSISPLNFNALLDQNPSMSRSIMRALCSRLRSAEERLTPGGVD